MALTPFARLEQKVSRGIDRLNAERVRVEPQTGGEYGNAPHGTRQPYEIMAIVDFKPVVVGARSSSRYGANVATVEAEEFHISISDQVMPTDRSQWPKAKDHIRLLDRDGEPVGRVMTVEPDGIGRQTLKMMRNPA